MREVQRDERRLGRERTVREDGLGGFGVALLERINSVNQSINQPTP